MRLRHRRLGPVDDIGDELIAVRQRHVAAIDVSRLLLIDEKQVAVPRPAGDVDVLADLDESIGAKNREAPVTPRGQTVGRKPVHANVSSPAITTQHHLAEVLEFRVLTLMVNVADLRGDDLGARRVREGQKLVRLVRRDIAQDPAKATAVEEPRRALAGAHAMRSQPDGLHDATDRAGLDELACLDGCAVLEALAVHDGVDAASISLHASHFRQLFE